MVRAGQATGNLDVVLTRVADYMASQRALKRKVIAKKYAAEIEKIYDV